VSSPQSHERLLPYIFIPLDSSENPLFKTPQPELPTAFVNTGDNTPNYKSRRTREEAGRRDNVTRSAAELDGLLLST